LIDSYENAKGTSASIEPFSRGHCFVPVCQAACHIA
jgi:hypothetical protein